MHRIASTVCLFSAAVMPLWAMADVQVINEQAGVFLSVIADGESDSVSQDVSTGQTPPFSESLALSDGDETVSQASAFLNPYSLTLLNGLSLSATGSANAATEISGSQATAIGFSGLALRFSIDRPAYHTAIGSLMKVNPSELGVDDSLVYAQLAKVNPQSGQPEGIWTSVANTGTVPFSQDGVLMGDSQYILTVAAYAWVESVWPDTPSASNSGSFDIDLDLFEIDPGDTDHDGDVDLDDLSTLANNYGGSGSLNWSQGDFDFDSDVDLDDLSVLASYYGGGEAQAMADFAGLASVPEPSIGLLAPLACLLARRTNRKQNQSPIVMR